MPRITVIGAGLAGSLLTIYLARRGFGVDVFEARPDMRTARIPGGRSINLALSDRGIAALREVGMDEYMLAEAVPMYGRMIHSTEDETKLLRYSGREGEYINSVSRAGLNIALMNEAEKYPDVQFIFGQRCVSANPDIGEVVFANGRIIRSDLIIATDGAGSVIREGMAQILPKFEMSQVFLEHGYKELHIPPGPNGSFQLEKNALHIWPRHKFMMIALPNADGSFTCTLFLAKTSADGSEPAFDQLVHSDSLFKFFEREFPDAASLMPTLARDFFANPIGDLGTVKCWPWNVNGKALLLGDSAHAILPFYGQGMNCAFEDVRVLDQLIEKHGTNWENIFWTFGDKRKFNTDAIADMAEENFYEMRDATADPIFQRKRELETRLEHAFPAYYSKYSMVTFRVDLPYTEAMEKGNAQDLFLMKYCRTLSNVAGVDLDSLMAEIRATIH